MSLFDLSGKIAIVTGGTKGIGRGIVEQLVLHGARVVVSSRSQADCDAVAAEVNAAHGVGKAVGIACDLTSLADVESLPGKANAAMGGLDILVANAAILPFIGPSAQTPPEMFDQIVAVNTHHNFRMCQAARPFLKARGSGSIVLIGSNSGHNPSANIMAYAVAKAGVSHMARCLADEFVVDDIRVNCVSPGLIRSFSSTPIWENPKMLEAMTKDIPLKRIGEPEDIAGAVIFLSSRAGSYISGDTIIVDGGRTQLSKPSTGKSALEEAMT